MPGFLSLEGKIQRKLKKLPEEIRAKTGYSTGIYHVSDKTSSNEKKCFKNNETCTQLVNEFELRIVGVLNEQRDPISINDLDPAIRDLLMLTNSTIRLCTLHFLEALADDTLGEVAQELDT